SQHTDHETRMRQLENLVRHGYVCDHAANRRNELSRVQQSVVAVFLQRCEAQKHSWEDNIKRRTGMPATKRKRASRKAKPKTKGMEALNCRLDVSAPEIHDLVARVEKEGGFVVGSCRDPLGGSPLLIAVLPIDTIE